MKEITPSAFRCGFTAQCPGVIKLDDGTYGYRNAEIWPTGRKGPNDRIVSISERDLEMIAAAIAEDKANG
jgi:hypothetical protein